MGKPKHSTAFKLEVVRHYLESGDGCRRTAKRFDLDFSAVRSWAAAYEQHGESGLNKGRCLYPAEFKLQVLEYIATEPASVRQACARFNIASFNTVLRWQRLYNAGGASALVNKPPRRPPSMPPKPPQPPKKPISEMTPQELKRELEYLRAENAYLKKLDALIRQERDADAKKKR